MRQQLVQDEWMHEHQTNWGIYCHLEIYKEVAQLVVSVVQETCLLQCEWVVLSLCFSWNFFFSSYMSSDKLFLTQLRSAIWPAILTTQAYQTVSIIDNYTPLMFWVRRHVFTSTNWNSEDLLRLCSPAPLTEAKLVQLRQNICWNPELEKQTSPK